MFQYFGNILCLQRPKRQVIWKAMCMQKIIIMPCGTNLSPSKSTGVCLLTSESFSHSPQWAFSKPKESLGLPNHPPHPRYRLHFNRLKKLPEQNTSKGCCRTVLCRVRSCFLSTLLTMRAGIHMHRSNWNKLQRWRSVGCWQVEDLRAATTLKEDSLVWNNTWARIKPTNKVFSIY